MGATTPARHAALDSPDRVRTRYISSRYTVLLLAIPLLLVVAAEVGVRRVLGPALDAYRRVFAVDVPVHLAIFRSTGGLFGIPPNPHAASRRLCWRNKRRYAREPFRTNSRGILSPSEIPYAHPAGKYRLLVLGDSSTAGLGLDDHADAWPQLLQATSPDTLEVVNAATIGYSSEQAREFLAVEGHKYRPDGVAIYLGNNDGVASAVTDRALLSSLRTRGLPTRLNAWLFTHSAVYAVFSIGARFMLTGSGGTQGEQLQTVRVPLDRYRDNLRSIVRWARSRAIDVYLITPPTPLEYPPRIAEIDIRTTYDPRWRGQDACLDEGEPVKNLLPAIVGTDETFARYPKIDFPIRRHAARILHCFEGRLAEQQERLGRLAEKGGAPGVVENNLGYVAAARGDVDEALAHVRRAIAAEPDVPEFHYNAGFLERRRGNGEAGAAELAKALDLDIRGARVHSEYLAAIRGIAADDRSVLLVDASRAFRQGDNEALFSDVTHPNRRGQATIAELMARSMNAGALRPHSTEHARGG
jgi:lysophospholipase L1-like esterase